MPDSLFEVLEPLPVVIAVEAIEGGKRIYASTWSLPESDQQRNRPDE